MTSTALAGALAKFGPPVSAIARRSPTSLQLLVTAASGPSQVDDIGSRAAEMVQDAWQSAKETTKKAANFVAGRAADTKESIKDDANAVKRAMNAEKNS